MSEEIDTGLGYCSECKKFSRLVKLHDIDAWPVGMENPRVPGIFLEDEVKFERHESGWTGLSYSGKAFEGCEFKYIDEEETLEVCKARRLDMCPFHCYGHNWGSETYHLIDCDCLHDEFENYIELKKHAKEVAPCIRDEEFSDFNSVIHNHVNPITVIDIPSKATMQKKMPAESIIPLVLKASRFVHAITYNIDDYFLGVLQTLAVKGVDVIIALNPSTLGKGRLKSILHVSSFSRGNLHVVVNNKVHAKRIFIDGIYDLDLASINLSYRALYDNIENIPELSFSTPSLSERDWEIIRTTHDQKFIPAFEAGRDILEWCSEKKPEVYKECSGAFERRRKEMELIEKMRERVEKSK